MQNPEEIDFDPCPNCGGKIMYLGADMTDSAHTLMCTKCGAMWDIEVETERLQDAWKDICKNELHD